MPAQTEDQGEKVIKHWFQSKLATRLLQAGQMAEDRAMLRRGARKQQDGTLGTPSKPPENDVGDDMQIHVGDEVHHHTYLENTNPPATTDSPPTVEAPPPAPQPPTGMSPRAKVVTTLGTALLASVLTPAIGLPLASWLGAFDKQPPPAVEAPEFSDRDTYPGVVIERPQ